MYGLCFSFVVLVLHIRIRSSHNKSILEEGRGAEIGVKKGSSRKVQGGLSDGSYIKCKL